MTDNFRSLRNLAPHIAVHRGKVFVVKIGGELLANPGTTAQIAEQLAVLHSLGIRLTLVHGGAPQIAALCRDLAIPVEMVNGRRITTPAVLRAVSMVLPGVVQTHLLATLQKAGLRCLGLSGVSAGIVNARRRPPLVQNVNGADQPVDYGEVGEVVSINTVVLHHLLELDYIPVVAPLGCDEAGAVLNINGDTVASEVAIAMGADKLIFILQAPGILRDQSDPASVISELTTNELEDLKKEGALSGGMLPKAAAAIAALEGGVSRVHLVSGLQADALLQELFSNEGAGTMVVNPA